MNECIEIRADSNAVRCGIETTQMINACHFDLRDNMSTDLLKGWETILYEHKRKQKGEKLIRKEKETTKRKGVIPKLEFLHPKQDNAAVQL